VIDVNLTGGTPADAMREGRGDGHEPAAAAFVRICPVDGTALEPVPAATVDEVRQAVTRARQAQRYWRVKSLSDRVAALKRAAKAMLRWRSEVVDLARTEMGKVDCEGLFNEGLGPLDNVSAWAGLIGRQTKREHVSLNPLSFPKKHAYVDLLPRGVVGVIAPWNFPVAGLYRSMIPALMTGNAVVLKPSEYTPQTSGWLASRLAAELPEGLVQVVHGDGRVGAALLDAGIDACVFTGSIAAGRSVRLQCAHWGIPSSVEMGSKDPAIVLADCDMPRTVAGITHWALSNAGQACGAIEILYVEQPIADELVERLRNAWTRLRMGPGDFTTLDLAPLANQRQFDLVAGQVREAIAKGARLVCGGAPSGGGLWFPPTILDRCTEEMSVVSDETFGPVLAVVRVETVMDAVRRTNGSRYGLGASIWTRDVERAKRTAEQLEVGVVIVNNHAFTGAIPNLPWSGHRDTGFGVANGTPSLATFVRPKTTVVDGSSSPELYWLPYDRTLLELGEALADAQIGRLAKAWFIPLGIRRRVETVRRFFK
jgi:acyl-CoA reductase-like NAD-dependent aldehyde dehydrogenase